MALFSCAGDHTQGSSHMQSSIIELQTLEYILKSSSLRFFYKNVICLLWDELGVKGERGNGVEQVEWRKDEAYIIYKEEAGRFF